MALPDLSFLSRHLTRLKEQEMASSLIHPPKLRRSNSCAGSVNRNPSSSDSPPDSGINTSADSIPVAYDLIQLDAEPLLVPAGPLKGRPASSEPDLLTADLCDFTGRSRCGSKGPKPLKVCVAGEAGSVSSFSAFDNFFLRTFTAVPRSHSRQRWWRLRYKWRRPDRLDGHYCELRIHELFFVWSWRSGRPGRVSCEKERQFQRKDPLPPGAWRQGWCQSEAFVFG